MLCSFVFFHPYFLICAGFVFKSGEVRNKRCQSCYGGPKSAVERGSQQEVWQSALSGQVAALGVFCITAKSWEVIKNDIILFENWFSEVTFLQENLCFLFNFMMKFQNEAFSPKALFRNRRDPTVFFVIVVGFFSLFNFKQLPPSIPAQQEKAELFRQRAVAMNYFLSQSDSPVLFPFPPFRKTGEWY